jgi:cytochrome c peroxidase
MCLALCAVAACSRADPSTGAPPTPRTRSPEASPGPVAARPREPSAAAEAGKQLFFDKALSASGRVACSTCHDPDTPTAPLTDADQAPATALPPGACTT